MKKISIAIGVMLAFVACTNPSTKNNSATSNDAAQTFSLDTTKLKSGEAFYQCEMNPEVISDRSGTCPKCGMELEKITKK